MIKIEGRKTDLGGGMVVHRILPYRSKRMVGPFCFLDHMGPVTIKPDQNSDVRPHPHIGLSTLTYLFEGHIVHRDSLGTVATIKPGEVNWMTSGKGISHSERSVASEIHQGRKLDGLQFWVALPDGQEDIDPSFNHYEQNQIPFHENKTRKITVVAGEALDMKSPVVTSSPMIFMTIESYEDFTFEFAIPNFELAAYVANGEIETSQTEMNQMLVFDVNTKLAVNIKKNSKIIIIGGVPFTTPRYLWWNFVSSSKEKIEIAKNEWKSGSFPAVPGETERIPLPEQ